MVAVVYDNNVKIPVDLSGKTGNISLPAWAAIQKELLKGSNERKLLACRILAGDLKHHPESVDTVLASSSLLAGLAEAATCGDPLVEREVCALIRICCYEADLRAGEAVASSPPLLNGLCRLALNEDPFVVETLSQLAHNNPKVLWLITTLLKVLRFQLKRDLKVARLFFTSFRTEVELMRTKSKILEATRGSRDPLPAMKSTLAFHRDDTEDRETVDRLCDVDEWIRPVKAATVREMNLRNFSTQSTVESLALPIKAATVRELKPSEHHRSLGHYLSPSEYKASQLQRMVDVDYRNVDYRKPVDYRNVDYRKPVEAERVCDVPEILLLTRKPPAAVTGRQTMCDVDVQHTRSGRSVSPSRAVSPARRAASTPARRAASPPPGRAVSPARQTMVDVDVPPVRWSSMVDVDVPPVRWSSMVDVDVPGRHTVDYRQWQTGRSTARDMNSTPPTVKKVQDSRSLSPLRVTRTSASPPTRTEKSPLRTTGFVEVIPWHKSQRYVMAAMSRSTLASTVRLSSPSSHQGVHRNRGYSTVQEQRHTFTNDKMCDVDEYLPNHERSTYETVTTRPRQTANSLYTTLTMNDRPKMDDSTIEVRQSTINDVLAPQPQEPVGGTDASMAFRAPLSAESSVRSTPRKEMTPGNVCDVEEYLPKETKNRTPDLEEILDTTKPSMPIYSTVDQMYSSSINLYTTNPGDHPSPKDTRADLTAFPSDWSEAIMIRDKDDDERAWF